jgi:hypothetical protein
MRDSHATLSVHSLDIVVIGSTIGTRYDVHQLGDLASLLFAGSRRRWHPRHNGRHGLAGFLLGLCRPANMELGAGFRVFERLMRSNRQRIRYTGNRVAR